MANVNRIGIDSKIFNSIPYSKLFIKIIQSSLQAVDPINVIKESFWIERNRIIIGDGNIILKSNQKARVIGFGKASQFMALGVKEVLGEYLESGVIITKHLENNVTEKLNPQILTLVGGHPIPTEESLRSTEFMLNFIEKIPENCPVICLTSGGGSSLLTKPAKNISLADYRQLTDLLIKSGATINEINTVRKHVDEVKGGGLARSLYPRYLLTLIISDVIDNPLSIIASGPTSIDETTFKQALDVIYKYHLQNSIKRKIIDYLIKGVNKKIPETIKEKNPILGKVNNLIIADNRKATIAAKKMAENAGFSCEILTNSLQGDAVTAGKYLGEIIKRIQQNQYHLKRPACLIAGGETTVEVKGKGMGGRNQEVALSASMMIDGIPNTYLITLATDGEDGPTNAAGAIVSGRTILEAKELGLNPKEYLNNNDSYNFFKKLGCLIFTGSTRTNVNDINFIFML